MDDATGPVVRSEFSTADSHMAEEFMRRAYAGNKLTITGTTDFTFAHVAVTGPGFSIDRVQVGVDMLGDVVADPGVDPLSVVHPVGGRLAYVEGTYPEVHADTGDVVLVPPQGRFAAVCERFDLAMVALDRSAVVAYAAATTGLDPNDLRFSRLAPLTPEVGRSWLSTVAHVRDHVLGDPSSAGHPILLDQAFRTLAATLLSTFPNNALDRVTGPDAQPVRGDVPAARLREVVEYLDTHADRPVGPADIAEQADAPYREVAATLRRRHGTHPAQLLWNARLAGAHRDLLAADPTTSDPAAGATVAAVAARWGFTDLRTFTAAYTGTMRETPERTLHR